MQAGAEPGSKWHLVTLVCTIPRVHPGLTPFPKATEHLPLEPGKVAFFLGPPFCLPLQGTLVSQFTSTGNNWVLMPNWNPRYGLEPQPCRN